MTDLDQRARELLEGISTDHRGLARDFWPEISVVTEDEALGAIRAALAENSCPTPSACKAHEECLAEPSPEPKCPCGDPKRRICSRCY